MQPFIMTRDINSYNGFGLPFTTIVFRTTLAANTSQNFTVPSIIQAQFKRVLIVFTFNAGANVFVGYNTTATIPGGSFSQDSNIDLNPQARSVFPGDILSFITADPTAYVSASLYCL